MVGLTTTSANECERRLADPEQNGLGLLRLVLAMFVLISHGFAIGGYGDDPLERFSAGTRSLGSMAVHGFFVISGYLVCQSWDRLRDVRKYFVRRALRRTVGSICLTTRLRFCCVANGGAKVGCNRSIQRSRLACQESARPRNIGQIGRAHV